MSSTISAAQPETVRLPNPSAASLRPVSRTIARTTGYVITSAARDVALNQWRAIEQRYTDRKLPVPLAASADWVAAWLQHYGSTVPHEFLMLSDDRGPCGLTLLTQGQGRGIGLLREQTRHLGTAGERRGESVCVEHNQLLVLPEHRMAFHDHITRHVLQDKSWEVLQLDGFTTVEFEAFQSGLPGFEVRFRDAPYFDLRAARAAGSSTIDQLGRSTRQNLRRLLRKYGDLEIQWAESRSLALEIFDELQQLHQLRWTKAGHPGAFHSQRFQQFQRTLIAQSFPDSNEGCCSQNKQRVVLFRVRQSGETVGCLLLLVDGNRLLDYLSGFGDFDRFASPGIVTHALCLEEALKRGYDEYDFLVGEKRHKENLSTNVNKLAWAVWTRPTLRGRMICMLRALKRRWGHFRHPAPTAQSATPAT